jgi:tetratricopeptide (TPR) repeat protein
MHVSESALPFDEAALARLVHDDDYSDAIAYCEDALAKGASARFWRRQLAYCLFLDERGPVGNQWERAPAVFEELVGEEPDDPDLRFWRGYLLEVALAGYDELGMQELRRAFDLDPSHPYANLVLAAYEEPRDAVASLKRTLTSQPNNYRALRYLAEQLAKLGREAEARATLGLILQRPPFVDSAAPLVLREYVNSVLTGAYWAERTRSQVAQELKTDERGKTTAR